jgi:hypothetical protein
MPDLRLIAPTALRCVVERHRAVVRAFATGHPTDAQPDQYIPHVRPQAIRVL